MENKKTALELIPDVMAKLGLLSIHDMKAYTTYEMLTLLAKRINQLIKEMIEFEDGSVEALKQMASELDELLRGDKVETEINKTLINWKESGIFDTLIKGSVFTDFESRLNEMESEVPALKEDVNNKLQETVEEVNTKVDEAVKQLETFNLPQFDSYPMFFKSFFGVRTSVIQDFRQVDENRWLVSQAGGATSIENGESFTLTMVNTNGELLSTMELINGGHGSMFNCQLQGDGSIDLYFTADVTTGYKIIKTKYVANGTFNAGQAGLTTIPKTSTECQLVYINFEEDKILLATTAGSGRWYKAEVFNFLDYLNGRQTTPLYVSNHTKIGNITSQGFAVMGDQMFVYAGTLGLNDITLRIVDLPSNTYVDYPLYNLGKLGEDTVTEGEGLFIDKHKNVYVGVATGSGGTTRNFNAYVYAHKTDQQHILGKSLETAQMYKLTDANGYAMGLSPLPARLSDITRPGWYYFTTNEMQQFTDISEEFAVAGYWLNVYPRSKDGGIYQELIRHTSGNNRWRLGRSINSDGTAYDWKLLTTQYKTIFSTDTRTWEKGQSFTLSDTIDNFDQLYIRSWGAGGKYETKVIQASLLAKEKALVIHHINLGDSDTSTGVYFQELQYTIGADLKTFTLSLKAQIGWNGTTMARTNDPSFGIVEIIGIRG